MTFSTLAEGFEAACLDDRSIRYTTDGARGESFTYSRLRARALGLLRNLNELGLKPGDELILCTTNNVAFVDAFWACQFGGIVPVPVAPGMTDDQRGRLFRVFGRLERPHLYTDHATGSRIRVLADRLEIGEEYRRLKAKTILTENITDLNQPADPVAADPDGTAFIQFSSGSTSDPKGVVLTHANLAANIDDIHLATRLGGDDKSLSWMPLTHDMGLIGFHIAMIMRGLDHCIMPTEAFLRRPTVWLQAATRVGATLLCSPSFGYRLFLRAFARWRIEELDLSRVRLIFNGAEPVSAPVCRDFLEALAPYGLEETSLAPVYGLAEATVAVSFPEPGRHFRSLRLKRDSLGPGHDIVASDDTDAVEIVDVGRPVRHCEVRIADDRGNVCPDARVGRILIRGPNVTAGYYGQEPAGNEAQPWLDTGDVGFMLEGSLYVSGRVKDILFVNGQNHYAHDLEDLVCSERGMDPGKVVVCGVSDAENGTERVVVFVLYFGEPEEFAPVAAGVRRTLGERAGVEAGAVVPVTELPRTTSGKIMRYALRLRYESGEFDAAMAHVPEEDPAAAAGCSQFEKRLLEICSPSLEGVRLQRHDNFFEIGMNSLKLIEIHELIEQHYPSLLEVSDLFDHPTLAELAVFLESRRRGASD